MFHTFIAFFIDFPVYHLCEGSGLGYWHSPRNGI